MRTGPGLAAAILACLAVIGCGGPGPVPSAVPSAATATARPAASATATPMSSAGTLEDSALLDLLPATIAGAEVVHEPEGFAEAIRHPGFVASVAAAAAPLVVSGDDWASGLIAQLRPGAYSDAMFRDWRDTYNLGACEPAGGLAGNAVAELGGRTVHIASCVEGLLVYHVYLPERNVVVSLFSAGEARFGEQLMAGVDA